MGGVLFERSLSNVEDYLVVANFLCLSEAIQRLKQQIFCYGENLVLFDNLKK